MSDDRGQNDSYLSTTMFALADVYPFATDTTPHAMWTDDLQGFNIKFLDSIDAGYFDYLSLTHRKALEGVHRERAALALRAAYAQGLETLFALLGSYVQAVHNPLGWMLEYTGEELRALWTKIAEGQEIITSSFPHLGSPAVVTFEDIATSIVPEIEDDPERSTRLRLGYARMWRRYAADLTDTLNKPECRGIRHGVLTSLDHFPIVFQAGGDLMTVASDASFCSVFNVNRPLGSGRNFEPLQVLSVWQPETCAKRLPWIARTIGLIVGNLRWQCGVDGEDGNPYLVEPEQEHTVFDEPWNSVSEPTILQSRIRFDAESVRLMSPEEILQGCTHPVETEITTSAVNQALRLRSN